MRIFTLFLLLIGLSFSTQATKPLQYDDIKSPKIIITTHAGDVWKGKLLETGPDAKTLSIITANNEEIEFSKAEVASVTQEKRESKYEIGNPFNGEYLLISSSFPYKESNLYIRANAASFVSLDYAITKHFSVGAGAFLADGLNDFPAFARLKVSIPITDHFCIAAGGLAARFDSNITAGLAYVSGSLGTEDIHVSGGIAYGFVNDELIKYPAFIFGAKVRFSNHFAVLTDNLVSPIDSNDTIGLISGGLRYFNQRIAIDGGIMAPFAAGYFTLDENTKVLPFGKLTVRIGK